MSDFAVGDTVRAIAGVYAPADEYAPAGWYCDQGDLLIIRKVGEPTYTYPYAVSHPAITDNSFGVKADEIELVERAALKEAPGGGT